MTDTSNIGKPRITKKDVRAMRNAYHLFADGVISKEEFQGLIKLNTVSVIKLSKKSYQPKLF